MDSKTRKMIETKIAELTMQRGRFQSQAQVAAFNIHRTEGAIAILRDILTPTQDSEQKQGN